MKDVHPEQRMTRSLVWDEQEEAVGLENSAVPVGEWDGCGLWQAEEKDGFVVHKRPGR